MDKTQKLQLLKDQQDDTSPSKRKPEVYFNSVELNCFMRNSKNERKNESKRKVWLSEMMINRIWCLIGYCLQFIHKSCDDTVIAAVRWTTWHQCNGETGTQQVALCSALCCYAHFQIGFGYDFLLALMEGNHRTCVMDLAMGTITGKSQSATLPTPYSIQCRHTLHVSIKALIHAPRIIKCSSSKTIQLNNLIFSHARSLLDRDFIHFCEEFKRFSQKHIY